MNTTSVMSAILAISTYVGRTCVFASLRPTRRLGLPFPERLPIMDPRGAPDEQARPIRRHRAVFNIRRESSAVFSAVGAPWCLICDRKVSCFLRAGSACLDCRASVTFQGTDKVVRAHSGAAPGPCTLAICMLHAIGHALGALTRATLGPHRGAHPREEADTLAHFFVCRRVRVEIEAVANLPSRDLALSSWLGLDTDCTNKQRAHAARRVVIACLAYHWARGRWQASREPSRTATRGARASGSSSGSSSPLRYSRFEVVWGALLERRPGSMRSSASCRGRCPCRLEHSRGRTRIVRPSRPML